MQIPLIHDVDVFVFGATSGAVTAALSVKAEGRTVVVASDRSYFGEETAGTLRLWPEVESDDPLFRQGFQGGAPPTPLHIKRTLEQALLQAGLPFLYTGRPVLALRGEDGTLAGFVLAARSSLYAVRCRVAIDASRTGILTRLAGVPLIESSSPGARRLIVIGSEPPQDQGFTWDEAPTPLPLLVDNPSVQAQAYVLQVNSSDARGSFDAQAAGEFFDWTQVYYPGLQHTADTWIGFEGPRLADREGMYDDPLTVPDAELTSADGSLYVMNGLLPLSDRGRAALWEFAGQLDFGRRVGRLAARAVLDLPEVAGPYVATVGTLETTADAPDLRFVPGFVRPSHSSRTIDVRLGRLPLLHTCDVLVAGGGTAGAPAGIAAARSGAKTVVLERLHGLGGIGTIGMISRYWYGNRVGFTREIDTGLDAFSADPRVVKTGGWNTHEKMGWFARTLRESGGTAWFGSFAFGVAMEGGRVVGVLASTPYGGGVVGAGAVVDATGNADLAAAAGAPCREVEAEHVAVQGTGLPPVRPGLHYRNTDHTFIDENDLVGVTHSFANARAKFANEFDVAPVVGTRERRQIVGEVELSPLDFLAERTFPDTVVTASSNFDSHGFTVHPVFMVIPPDKQPLRAHVPFRCMLPQRVERLLVTGLGMSAHRDALPVVRMQPDVQNQGYAAGLAASRAALGDVDFRSLDVRALQRELVAQGILEEEVLGHDDSLPLPDDVVRAAVAAGPTDLYSVAVMFAHPEVSTAYLLERMRSGDAAQQEEAARILGLMGREEAAETLATIVAQRDWDEGWDYTGMGQFGSSVSPVDTLIIALGKTGSPVGVRPILRKIEALTAESAFSHFRAVSVAASALADPELSAALYRLLQKPGMQGHAQLDTAAVIAHANSDPIETEARNRSLKELILGRGLYLCGDYAGLGKRILETYANDLRGHYARHARAVLACQDIASLRRKVL